MKNTRRTFCATLLALPAAMAQSPSFDDALARGKKLFADSEWQKALDAFGEAASLATSDDQIARAKARQGQALAKLGRTREAIEYLQDSLAHKRFESVEEQIKQLRLEQASRVQTTDEIRAALADQVSSNRSTRVMPRRPVEMNILFDFNQAALKPEGIEAVHNLGAALQAASRERVRIEGHTDLVGDSTYNQRLSERRAQAVAAKISQEFKIPRAQLIAVGKGMSQPLYPGTGEEESRLNRRVEVTVLKPGEN